MRKRICDDVMRTNRPFLSMNVFTVEVSVVPLYKRTLLIVVAQQWTGHSGALLERCCVMVAIFSPFFWETKVMETQSAERSDWSGEEWSSSVVVPSLLVLKKRMLLSSRIFVLRALSALLVVEYSQERIAKKSAPQTRGPTAEVKVLEESARRCFQTTRGRHAWLFLAGSLS